MHLQILATGKTRDANLLALEDKYARRLPHPWSYEVRELKASPQENPQAASREEATHQLEALKKEFLTIALDETGKLLTSQQWAEFFRKSQQEGGRKISFLIGGAAGLTDEVRKSATHIWSLSPLTLPHQLVRVVLAEQLYRTFTLLTGHPYHRE